MLLINTCITTFTTDGKLKKNCQVINNNNIRNDLVFFTCEI